MDVVFHSHHATVSERMRERAERGLRKLAARLPGAVGATIRFDQDGPERTVELILHSPARRQLFAKAGGRFWGPAIAAALAQLEQQVTAVRRTRKEQGRQGVAERRIVGA